MKYPNLCYMIRLIAADNGLSIKPVSEFVWPLESPSLEGLASRISKSDMEVLATGEQTEQQIVDRFQLEPLQNFLERVFDGDLHLDFFVG